MPDLEQLPDATDTTEATAPSTQSSAKSSSQKQKNATKNQILSEFTIRKPDWAYIRLQHLSHSAIESSSSDLDGVTAQLHLTAALTSFLGVHGSAVPIDILRLEHQDVWIRVPADDRAALIAAAGGGMSSSGDGWRVKGWSNWNPSAVGRDAGQEMFD
ncbi:Putative ribonuclease P/MRP protein subunit Pop8 [Septoria linicola]|uniref:Ribonuclease P/MRP protein subunit Pop8 n=1 Tax=Septoria linicola TaxID=215465 RepID=A0A9Q9EH22_9PEZI|nr:putative ribonuclease P/MRP protein subunit Pop8 [Septoria linicola]USW49529.1 Putative ribonuclease P/MRP protein subunit Pop8 [Septoria linicola]